MSEHLTELRAKLRLEDSLGTGCVKRNVMEVSLSTITNYINQIGLFSDYTEPKRGVCVSGSLRANSHRFQNHQGSFLSLSISIYNLSNF